MRSTRAVALLPLAALALALLVVVAGRATSPAGASTVVPLEGASPATSTVTLLPTADAYVDQRLPNVNYGGTPSLLVEHDEFLQAANALLRFDLSAVPRGSTLESASLQLYLNSAPVPGTATTTVRVGLLSAAWNEATVTWDTRPAQVGGVWGAQAVPPVTGLYYTWNVLGLVHLWVNEPAATPNNGLTLTGFSSAPYRRVFESREGAHSPRLVVSFTPPAPTATPTRTATASPSPTRTPTRTLTPAPAASLTATSTPTIPGGRSLQLDGEDSYVSVPHSAQLNVPERLTIEAWVKRAASRCETVVGNGWQQSYWLGLCSDQIRFYRGGVGSFVDGNAIIPPGVWTHVAVTYDGTTRRYYVNGELDRETTETAGPLAAGDSLPLRIGADRHGGYYFQGLIDEVRLWSVVRSQEQIRSTLYQAIDGPQEGLLAVWHFDGSAADAAGGHDGDLAGGAAYSPEGFPQGEPTPTPVASATPTATQMGAGTSTPTSTATPTSTETPTPTPTASATPGLGSIGDRVWHDVNRDGGQDPPIFEPGIANVRLLLVRDDVLEGMAVTDAGGSYLFSGLRSGTYRVDVDEWSLPPGFALTGGVEPRLVFLADGEELRTVDFGYAPAPTPTPTATPIGTADLWIMGIEVNQGLQDYVFTDLERSSGEAGWVPQPRSPFAAPILPGKPMVVRVFVGLRNTPDLPDAGVRVTGQLATWTGEFGGAFRSYNPLENGNCAEQSGTTSGQACRRTITLYRGLGRQGLNTNTDFDLDLIHERSHWQGTLNFVIPPEATRDLPGGLVLEASVSPVGTRELQFGDNVFRLELGNVAPQSPLRLRVVRVEMPGAPAPSRTEAIRALEHMRRLTPYTGLSVSSNTIFRYGGEFVVIRAGGLEVGRLTQLQTLWLRLYQAFGLDPSRTLLALTPATRALGTNTGLGWRVPSLDGGYYGGIAVSRTPEYAGNDAEDERRIAVLAQELYHADGDVRHESNDHTESTGCLPEALLDFVGSVLNLDSDCWKPAQHPHGAIGEYPPGTVFFAGGAKLEGRIFGNRGAVGVDIEPNGASWKLTLYDPCPTGPMDGNNPLATFGQRWDAIDSRYACTVADTTIPHDFMSYGDNRWPSEWRFLGRTEPPFRTPAAAESVQNAAGLDDGSTLQVSGVIDATGAAGFTPLFSAPAGGAAAVSDAVTSPLTLEVEGKAGERVSIPLSVAIAPPHPESFLFFQTTLPPGLAPQRLGLKFQEDEVASATASPNAPTIRVVSPNGGEVWSGSGVQTIRWEADDADGDELSTSVQFSADGGQTWEPLGIVTEETSLDVEVSTLTPTRRALIRVTASDGLNVTADRSDDLFTVMTSTYLPLILQGQ